MKPYIFISLYIFSFSFFVVQLCYSQTITVAASERTSNSATITATGDLQNSFFLGCWIKIKKDTEQTFGAEIQPTQTTGTTYKFSLTNLTANTKYIYQVFLKTKVKESDLDNTATIKDTGEKNFWTLAEQPTNKPNNFAATLESYTDVKLSFESVVDANISGYIILAKEGTTYSDLSQLIDGTAPGTGSEILTMITTGASFTHTISSSGKTYSYTLVAFKSGTDNSTYNYLTSNDKVSKAQITTAPSAPVPNVTSKTSNSFSLSWATVPSATSYKVYVSKLGGASFNGVGGPLTGYNPLTRTETTATVTGLADNSKYYYKVVALIGTTEGPTQIYDVTTNPALGFSLFNPATNPEYCAEEIVDFVASGYTVKDSLKLYFSDGTKYPGQPTNIKEVLNGMVTFKASIFGATNGQSESITLILKECSGSTCSLASAPLMISVKPKPTAQFSPEYNILGLNAPKMQLKAGSKSPEGGTDFFSGDLVVKETAGYYFYPASKGTSVVLI